MVDGGLCLFLVMVRPYSSNSALGKKEYIEKTYMERLKLYVLTIVSFTRILAKLIELYDLHFMALTVYQGCSRNKRKVWFAFAGESCFIFFFQMCRHLLKLQDDCQNESSKSTENVFNMFNTQ